MTKPSPYSRIKRIQNAEPETLIRLWTFQTKKDYAKALEIGKFIGNEWTPYYEQEGIGFRRAYDWMRQQMSQKINNFSGHRPIWAWIKRPSTRRIANDTVLISALVPKCRILLSDFDPWHIILNNCTIDDTTERVAPFETSATWEKIFDLDRRCYVQACVDGLNVNEILYVSGESNVLFGDDLLFV